jgi:exportin-5
VEALLEVQKAQTPLERMQYFLSLVHEHCYLILGAAGPTLGHSLYTMPGLSTEIVSTALSSLDCIPDYRLRPIIRVFLKAFISACPSCHEAVIMPILISLCPYSKYNVIPGIYITNILNLSSVPSAQ